MHFKTAASFLASLTCAKQHVLVEGRDVVLFDEGDSWGWKAFGQDEDWSDDYFPTAEAAEKDATGYFKRVDEARAEEFGDRRPQDRMDDATFDYLAGIGAIRTI